MSTLIIIIVSQLTIWLYCRWAAKHHRLPMAWWMWLLIFLVGSWVGVLVYSFYRNKNKATA